MKDAKGHGSNSRGMHQSGVDAATAASRVVIQHHPDFDEYRVPGPRGTEAQASYHNDKEDAEGTARYVYGPNVQIVHRTKRYS